MSIVKCKTEEDIRKVKKYIGSDYTKVPYLYTNLHSYGIGNTNIEVWYDDIEGKVNAVYLRYFTCLHFYTQDNDYPKKSFLKLVQCIKPQVIMLDDIFGKKALSSLELYSLTRQYLIKHDTVVSDYSKLVSFAEREDIHKIAELLIQDRVYQEIYTRKELEQQLFERFDAGYGKCCIIKIDGEIVANYSINGENDKFAFCGSLIVQPEHRRKGLAQLVRQNLFKYVQNKGLECFSFIGEDNIASLKLSKKMNSTIVGEIYKLHKK